MPTQITVFIIFLGNFHKISDLPQTATCDSDPGNCRQSERKGDFGFCLYRKFEIAFFADNAMLPRAKASICPTFFAELSWILHGRLWLIVTDLLTWMISGASLWWAGCFLEE